LNNDTFPQETYDPFLPGQDCLFSCFSAQDLDRTSFNTRRQITTSGSSIPSFHLLLLCCFFFCSCIWTCIRRIMYVCSVCLPLAPSRLGLPSKITPDKRSLSGAVTNVSQHQPPQGFTEFCLFWNGLLDAPDSRRVAWRQHVSKALMMSNR
jgi:hypothetical protein